MSVVKLRESIQLGTGVTAYGGKYALPESIGYINDDTIGSKMYLNVQVHGLVKCASSVVKGSVIGRITDTLAMPGRAVSFPAVTNGGFVRLQVESNGNIVLERGEILDYVFLDSIKFDNWLTS